jgi:hypothetical protein
MAIHQEICYSSAECPLSDYAFKGPEFCFGSRLCGNAKRTLVSRNLSVIPQNFAPNVLLKAAERSYGVPVTQ